MFAGFVVGVGGFWLVVLAAGRQCSISHGPVPRRRPNRCARPREGIAALYHRERTGEGHKVEVSLIDCSMTCHELNIEMWSASGETI